MSADHHACLAGHRTTRTTSSRHALLKLSLLQHLLCLKTGKPPLHGAWASAWLRTSQSWSLKTAAWRRPVPALLLRQLAALGRPA